MSYEEHKERVHKQNDLEQQRKRRAPKSDFVERAGRFTGLLRNEGESELSLAFELDGMTTTLIIHEDEARRLSNTLHEFLDGEVA